jgi:peptide/nickel transport system permease protein
VSAEQLRAGILPRILRISLRSIGTLVVTLAALLCVTFALSTLSPVDPALRLVGDHASAATYQQARHSLGLDLPWPQRLDRYAAGVVHGDLGISQSTGAPVAQDLRRVFPATVELATLAMLLATLLGIALALVSAARPGGILDAATRVLSLAGNSLPIFWLGLLALYLFYAQLQWTGGPGRLDDAYEYTIEMPTGLVLVDAWHSGVPGALTSAISHMVLPVLLLAGYAVGNIARLARAALLEESRREYVLLARATGASAATVLLRHMLPNTAGVLLTVLALTYANLLQGAVLVETVFARPGIGRYLTTALFAADAPAILGSTLVIGACFVLINGITDLLVRLLDPRSA